MESIKKIFLVLFILLLAGGGAYGGFILIKKYFKKAPVTQIDTKPSTASTIPGFARDITNKIPVEIPADLITEKNISSVDSFTVKKPSDTQATYQYITKLSSEENYNYFRAYVRKNGWEIKSINRFNGGWEIAFSKPNIDILVTYSINKTLKEALIDITASKKTNE